MAASTIAREASARPGEYNAYPMGAVKINKGTLVCVQVATGYVFPLRAPGTGSASDLFVGVAEETVDNSAGTAGAVSIIVRRRGTFVFNMSSPAQTNIGAKVYGVDDQDVGTTSTNAVLVGNVTLLDSSSTVRVQIDNAVQ